MRPIFRGIRPPAMPQRPPEQQRAELLREEIEPLRRAGMSLNAIADKLNADGSLTPRGRAGSWTPTAVSRVIARF